MIAELVEGLREGWQVTALPHGRQPRLYPRSAHDLRDQDQYAHASLVYLLNLVGRVSSEYTHSFTSLLPWLVFAHRNSNPT